MSHVHARHGDDQERQQRRERHSSRPPDLGVPENAAVGDQEDVGEAVAVEISHLEGQPRSRLRLKTHLLHSIHALMCDRPCKRLVPLRGNQGEQISSIV